MGAAFMYPPRNSLLRSFKEYFWIFSKTKQIFFERLQIGEFVFILGFILGLGLCTTQPRYLPLSLLFACGPMMLINLNIHTQFRELLSCAEVIVINHNLLLLCKNPNQRHADELLSQNLLRYWGLQWYVLDWNLQSQPWYLLDVHFTLVNYAWSIMLFLFLNWKTRQ